MSCKVCDHCGSAHAAMCGPEPRHCSDCGRELQPRVENALAFTLREHDGSDQEQQLSGIATEQGGALLIHVDGYGDFCSANGQGTVVVIELDEGCARILVWADINEEDPTHTISLEKAREDKRRPC